MSYYYNFKAVVNNLEQTFCWTECEIGKKVFFTVFVGIFYMFLK